MNKKEYMNVLIDKMHPRTTDMFGKDNFVFLDNNAPCLE